MRFFILLVGTIITTSKVFAAIHNEVSSDGRYLVREAGFGSGTEGTLSVLSTETGKLVFEEKFHFQNEKSTCLLKDRIIIIDRNKLAVRSLETGKELDYRYFPDQTQLTGIACHEGKNIFAVGTKSSFLLIVNAADFDVLHFIEPYDLKNSTSYLVQFSEDGNTLVVAVGGYYNHIHIFDVPTGKIRAKSDIYHPTAMDVNPDGSLIAFTTEGVRTLVIDGNTGYQLFDSKEEQTKGIALPRFYKNSLIVAGTAQSKGTFIKSYSLESFKPEWNVESFGTATIKSFDVTKKYNRILISNGDLYFVDPATGKSTWIEGPYLTDWAFSPTRPVALTNYKNRVIEEFIFP